MQKILLISDMPIGASNRGAEANDKIIYDSLHCDFYSCEDFNNSCLTKKYDKYIISNFALLSQESKEILSNKKYVHIAHDFLFTPSRNPFYFKDGIVPNDQKINQEFFKNAKTIYTQSSFQQTIFENNSILANYKNIGGNLWTNSQLEFMLDLRLFIKKPIAAILGNQLKGAAQSVELCKALNIPYEIFDDMPYYQFLQKLAKYSTMVFIPFIPETFSRVLIECKLMGVLPITHNNCGATYEEVYKLNEQDLADELIKIRDNFLEELKNE